MSKGDTITIESVLSETALALLESQGRVQVEDVVEEARAKHPATFDMELERLVNDAAARIVKDVFRRLSQDDHPQDDQLTLPGLTLPSAIAVENEGGGFTYVATSRATWPELLAGRSQREQNVMRAQKRLDQYDESLNLLRPIMEDDPGLSVEEAVRRLRERN